MFAPHQQGAGEPQRDLDGAREMFDIALCPAGVERILRDVFEAGPCLAADEFLPAVDDGFRIVVYSIARDFAWHRCKSLQRVAHFEFQPAEGLTLEDQFQVVLSLVQWVHGEVKGQQRRQGKIDRIIGIDLVCRILRPGREAYRYPVTGNGLAVESNVMNLLE